MHDATPDPARLHPLAPAHLGWGWALLSLIHFGVPGDLDAQGCVGIPGGSTGLVGAAVDSDLAYGAEGGLVADDAFAFAAGYARKPIADDISTPSDARHDASLLGTVPITAGDVRLCPALGAELDVTTRRDGLGGLDIWSFPVGVGMGRELPLGGGASLIGFVFPQAVYVNGRPEFRVTEESRVVRERDAESVDARLDVGVGLR